MLHPRPRRERPTHGAPEPSPTTFWGLVVGVWGALATALVGSVALAARAASAAELVALVVIGVSCAAIWFSGVRFFALWWMSSRWGIPSSTGGGPSSTSGRALPRGRVALPGARVALLYCAADDFDAVSLERSMRQSREVSTVILDDSRHAASRAEIDAFARRTGAEVVRRRDRVGFKAGNLNHGLRAIAHRVDHVVVLDSDGVLPRDFVAGALDVVADDPRVGIVQGRHVAAHGATLFTAWLSGMLGTHVAVTQSARSRVGFSMFMGRGAMISTRAWRDAGGIPEVVMEDVAFTLQMRRAGYRVHYAPHLVSVEEFPVDYHAFRTQYRKLVEGTVEFLRTFGRRVITSRMRAAEKIDVLAEQASVPVAAFAGLALMLGSAALAVLPGDVQPPLWATVLTGVLASAPLVPETVRRVRRHGPVAGVVFWGAAAMLYGSLLLLTVRATALVVLGRRATFRITPKTASPASLAMLRDDAIVAVCVTVAALLLAGSVAPVLALVGPIAAAPLLVLLGGRPAPRGRARAGRARAIRQPVGARG